MNPFEETTLDRYGFPVAEMELRKALIDSLGVSLTQPDALRNPEYVGRWRTQSGYSGTFFLHKVVGQPYAGGTQGLLGVILDTLGVAAADGAIDQDTVCFRKHYAASQEGSPHLIEYRGYRSGEGFTGEFVTQSPDPSMPEHHSGDFDLVPYAPETQRLHRFLAEVHLRPFAKSDLTLGQFIRVSHLYKPAMSEAEIEQHFADMWAEGYGDYSQPMDMVRDIARSEWGIPTQFTHQILLEGAPLTSAQKELYCLEHKYSGVTVERRAPGEYVVKLPK
jgi:hypothetical protein